MALAQDYRESRTPRLVLALLAICLASLFSVTTLLGSYYHDIRLHKPIGTSPQHNR